jgi:gamma-glutamyltranspeptidase/glutathione hydrolase
MPDRGPSTVTVPGTVAGWETVHRLGARLPWSDAFARATDLADGGVPLPRSHAMLLADPGLRPRFAADPGMGEVFYAEGVPLAEGAVLRQPALARTLATLAAGGAAALYRGPVGAAYVAGLAAAGSPMSTDDLASHEALILPPLLGPLGTLHVGVAPPPSPGSALLQILALTERLGLEPDPLGPDAGSLAQVVAATMRDVRRHLADPDRMLVHPSSLLDDGHLAALADEVRAGGPAGPEPSDLLETDGPHPDGDTIALVAADAEGHAVSLIQSLWMGFGSGILDPATGILGHSRGACFTLAADHPAAFTPGARPPHTLVPVVLHDGGGLAAVAGTMGGRQQPQIDAQTLLHLVRGRRTPAEAVASPRWVVEDLPDDDRVPPVAVAERSVPLGVVDAMAAAGFDVLRVDDLDRTVGHAQLVAVDEHGLHAGSDPRADGAAAAG